ncbi:autotransporter domain-containing protein [Tardiphaga sp. 1201_B9_N1_1]|uniref:autotransporter domain-containing protein n=1 Tax=unclassified Tardiphaga TaxID=2631404 RepID=UPI003F26564E
MPGNSISLRNALLASASLLVLAAPPEALAACSGLNTATVLCDAANPSGGRLETFGPFETTVNIDVGAGLVANVTGGNGSVAGAFVQGGTGDLMFNLTDPAGIWNTHTSNGTALALGNTGTGAIIYRGWADIRAAGVGLEATGAGAITLTQSSGVIEVDAGGRAIKAVSSGGDITIDTTGSRINGVISTQTSANGAVTITTDAISGIETRDAGSGTGSIKITANGVINNPLGNAISISHANVTGPVEVTTNAEVHGGIGINITNPSTAPVTLTLTANQTVTGAVGLTNANGNTVIRTRAINGGLFFSGAGSLDARTDGDITNASGAAGVYSQHTGEMNAIINGAVSTSIISTGTVSSIGESIVSSGVSTSGQRRTFISNSAVTTSATSTTANVATANAVSVSWSNSPGLDMTVAGPVSATALGETTLAIAAQADIDGGDLTLLLRGPVTATANNRTNINFIGGPASAQGIAAGMKNGGNIDITAYDNIVATGNGTGASAKGIYIFNYDTTPTTARATVLAHKNVTAIATSTATGVSIDTQLANIVSAGPGPIEVTVEGAVTATSSAAAAIGVDAIMRANPAMATPLTIRIGGNVVAAGLAASSYGIRAEHRGNGDIVIDVGGAVQSSGVGISASRTLAGNIIINAIGGVTGTTGVITTGGTTTLTVDGQVTGTGGTAVQFGGSNDTLRLLSGATVTGHVIGTGTSILQLGGTSAGIFDMSGFGVGLHYAGFASLGSAAGSRWSLIGNSSYAGTVNIDGLLAINGSLPNAIFVIGAGGTIGGSGSVGQVSINGGTLSPGNSPGTLTMASLAMTAASTYLVQVEGPVADKAIVTGAATLAGRVVIDPLARLTQRATYTILTAGTLTGTFESASLLLANNLARNPLLSYVGNDVLLTLDPGMLSPILPTTASGNQVAIAGAIDAALAGGSPLSDAFSAIFKLNGNDLLRGLTQISGATATGSQQTTINAINLFLGVMTDPFTAGRSSAAPDASLGYAATDTRPGPMRDAFAAITKAAPRAPAFEQRWNVWAAGFGGSQMTDGNATTGTNDARSNIGGVAVGADVLLSPNTVAGFSLAGAGTSFSVANSGSGRSDLFQAGAFIRHTVSSAYITAAAAYGWQDITTDRIVTVAGLDRLHAQFNANAFSGRIEAGNRTMTSWLGGVGVTPYVAAQVIAFDLPSYAESTAGGAATFALNYAGKTVTSTRSELGMRADKSFAVKDAILTLRSRAAWAHDYNSDRSIAATFQSLPGASFTVSGAAPARDAALTTASAEMTFISGISLAATFEGEFSDVTRSYAGKGTVRYAW